MTSSAHWAACALNAVQRSDRPQRTSPTPLQVTWELVLKESIKLRRNPSLEQRKQRHARVERVAEGYKNLMILTVQAQGHDFVLNKGMTLFLFLTNSKEPKASVRFRQTRRGQREESCQWTMWDHGMVD